MYIDYKIIRAKHHSELEHKVNAWMDTNIKYQPIGQPFYANGEFHQAIGIYEPEKINLHIKK